VLKSYLPILVFAVLGITVGGVFAMLNHLIGPKKPAKPTAASRRQGEPYESGIPVEAMKGFKFGVSFYLLAMLFIRWIMQGVVLLVLQVFGAVLGVLQVGLAIQIIIRALQVLRVLPE